MPLTPTSPRDTARASVFIDDRLGHIKDAGTLEDVGRVTLVARPAIPEVVVVLNRTGTQVFDVHQRLEDVDDVGLHIEPAVGTGKTSTKAVLVSANSWTQYPLVLISKVTVYVPGTS